MRLAGHLLQDTTAGSGLFPCGSVSRFPLSQVGSALGLLHSLCIAHRDVKPANVLFTDASRQTVKLCVLFAPLQLLPTNHPKHLTSAASTMPALVVLKCISSHPLVAPSVLPEQQVAVTQV